MHFPKLAKFTGLPGGFLFQETQEDPGRRVVMDFSSAQPRLARRCIADLAEPLLGLTQYSQQFGNLWAEQRFEHLDAIPEVLGGEPQFVQLPGVDAICRQTLTEL